MIFLNNLLDQYQILIYLFYQNFYKVIFTNYHNINFFFFVVVTILGSFTVITPCFISMFPMLLSYIYSTESTKFNQYLFIFGIMSSIFCLLFFSNFINIYFIYQQIPILSSFILILISLNLMQVLNFSFIFNLFYDNLNLINQYGINSKSYFVGLTTGISSVPCNTSIALLMVFLLKQLDNALIIFFSIFMYLCGSFFTLLFIINLRFNDSQFKIFSPVWELIVPFSGSFLLFFSLLSFLRSCFI
uniref:Thiol:disulfide interchange protein n=1 Tax=Chondria sp. (in: red algae) TaxID=1982705 RepID=A0A1Z1MDB9_9FLOR|nr:thiol:disulfide interchange protein [Chondria sp. (in: red algae)]